MPWRGADHEGEFPSLGWQLLEWCSEFLPSPAGESDPLVFTNEQALLLVEWYAIDPETGRFLHRRGASRRSKGCGKSPVEAAKAIAELAGDVLFAGWDAAGEPVGRPWGTKGSPPPHVQIAAVSEDQTENTYGALYEFLHANDGKAARDLGIDLGLTRCYLSGRPGKLEPVTAAAGSREGQRVTYAVLDEALSLGTVIPTPTGWTTMADIQVGDHLLSPDGAPVRVTKTTEITTDRPCYRLTFADQTTLVADAGHLWMTRRCAQVKPKVQTTEDLVRDGRRYHVPLTQPVQLPEADLLIDPYVFGLWCGDGSAHQPHIAVSAEDADWVVAEIRDRGEHVVRVDDGRTAKRIILGRDMSVCMHGHDGPFEIFPRGGARRSGRRCVSCRAGVAPVHDRVKPFRVRLTELGVRENKHVPAVYLRGSFNQRVALLQGLMDSDGHAATTSGICTFVNTNERLVDAVIELVRSLGMLAQHTVREDHRSETYRPVHKVTFMARHGIIPFTLPRKAKRVRQSYRQDWKAIVSIEPVPSEPVKCIAVDSPDHLFLAGDGWTTTHNTHLWTPQNGGVKLARTLRRNVAKMGGRSYETTNSFAPGENSVAEGTHKAVQDGQPGIFYDAVEAPEVKPEDPDETLKAALKVAYGGAYWIDLDRIVAEIRDPETPWEDAERFYFNHNVDDRQKAVPVKRWGELARPDIVVPGGARIALGFDGSISDDCTALIGCHLVDGAPHTFEIEVWGRPQDAPRGWRIPRRDVMARIREVFGYWDVGLLLADPPMWQTEIEDLIDEFGEEVVQFFDTNQPARMWKACDRFSTAITEGAYSHDGSAVLSSHVVAMHKRKVRVRDADDDGRTRFVFVKGPDRLKIDAGIGAVLALEAAATMPEVAAEQPFFAAWR